MSTTKIPNQITPPVFGKKEKIFLVVSGTLALICIAKLTNLFGFSTFLDSIITPNEQGLAIISLLGLMLAGICIFVGYGFIQMIKNEMSASKYRKAIQVGDSVHFSGSNTSFDGEVLETDDTYVTVKVKLYKGSVYPNKD